MLVLCDVVAMAMAMASVVPDVAVGVSEEKVTSKAFELVFAFDEVITTGGHKENINLQQASKNDANDANGTTPLTPGLWSLVSLPSRISEVLVSK